MHRSDNPKSVDAYVEDFRFYIEVLLDAAVLAPDSRFKNVGLSSPALDEITEPRAEG
jgi:hypothetical protein